MSEGSALYEDDLVRWSVEQAAALRAAAGLRTNSPIDWENIAEEIGTVGRSQRHELRKRTRTVVRHLLKLQHSRATEPKRGWEVTIRRSRQEIADLIGDSPSLRSERDAILQDVLATETELTAQELHAAGDGAAAAEMKQREHPFELEQVFDDWFPDEH